MSTVSKPVTFGRRQRLAAAADFDKVFREGQRSTDRLFIIIYRANGLGAPRLGFAIARQKIRRAVGRNRLRRLTRESLRALPTDLPGFDIVVIAKDAAGLAGNPEIFASLHRHWARLRQFQ